MAVRSSTIHRRAFFAERSICSVLTSKIINFDYYIRPIADSKTKEQQPLLFVLLLKELILEYQQIYNRY